MIVVVVYRDTTDDCPKKSLKNIFESVTQSKHDLSMNPNAERQNCSIKPPTLMDFTGVANAQGPSPHLTAYRSPSCSLITATGINSNQA